MTATSGIEEGRRQAYLASLGLPLWTARHDLPGAAPSSLLVFEPFWGEPADTGFVAPEVAPGEVAQGVVARGDSLPEATVATTVAAVAPVAAREPVPPAVRQDAEAVPASGAPASAATVTRFTLRVQALAPGWLGIMALGDVPDLSAQEYRLLSALGHALGAAPDFTGSASLLRWPLNNNPRLDHSEAAAIEWLRHALKVPEGWRCVVLGEVMSVLVRTALPASTAMVAGPALATLLSTPLAKKSLWLSLHA